MSKVWITIRTHFSLDRCIEYTASVLTIAGMLYGSTTRLGASLYLASAVFWIVIMVRKRLWGLWPMNVAGSAASLYNLLQTFR